MGGSSSNSSYWKTTAARSETDSEWGISGGGGADKLDVSPMRVIGDYKLMSRGI